MYFSRVMRALRDRFRDELVRRRLFAGGGRALLAVSGGPDSLALLDLMAPLSGALALELIVIHADHGIHAQSASCAQRVRAVAANRYGFESVVESLGLGAGASETAARTARYRFFRRVQQERDARWLVTAHHADDQAETVLIRLLRGSGPSGLAGMPRRGPHGLVRPLLDFTRDELLAHCRSAGLEPFVDPANSDPRHTRSWLRAAVLPLLESRLGAGARESLLETAAHARADNHAWDVVLDLLPGLDVRHENGTISVARQVLSGYDKVLAGRMLRVAARRAGWRIGPRSAARVVAFAASAASGRRLDVGEGLIAEIAFDRLVIGRPALTPESRPLTPSSGAARFGAFTISWRQETAPARLERGGWTTWAPSDALTVRALARGDRLAPLGGTGHRAAVKLLMEAKVARGSRASWPVLVHGDEPFWIPGVCRGSALLPAPGATATRIDVTAG